MEKTITVFCKNNGEQRQVPLGASLLDAYQLFDLHMEHGPMSARVNNKVEGLKFRLYNPKVVEFLDVTSSSGLRTYTRTLFFVLCKAAHDLYPDCSVTIDIPVSNGYYVDLQLKPAPREEGNTFTNPDEEAKGEPVTLEVVGNIRRRMQEIIAAALPIHRYQVTTEEAIKLFTERGAMSKVKLLQSLGSLYTIYYDIDGYSDYYYGSLLTNTSQLYLFGLEKYYDGLLLRIPSIDHPSELGEMTHQDKMFGIFQ